MAGGKVVLTEGTFTMAAVGLLDSYTTIEGQGMGVTIITAANGLDADLFQSRNWATLNGTNDAGGEAWVTLRDFTIDGNKANQASGWCLRKYGYRWDLTRMEIRHGKDGNVASEWGQQAAPEGGMEDIWNGCHIHRAGGLGIDFKGPHDSMFTDCFVFRNVGGAVFNLTANLNGAACHQKGCHYWANGATEIGLDIRTSHLLTDSIYEGSAGAGGIGVRVKADYGNAVLRAVNLDMFLNETHIELLTGKNQLQGSFRGAGLDAIRIGGAGESSYWNVINGDFSDNEVDFNFANSAGGSMIKAFIRNESGQKVVDGTVHADDRLEFVTSNSGGTDYKTSNSGTATLVNGQTSIVVTHGLGFTPVAGDIMVTPMESLAAASEFYIDTYTATQFTIHVDINPTQDVDFAWKAVVL